MLELIKPEPETVSVDAAEPAFSMAGVMEVMAGVGVVVPPPPPLPPELPEEHPVSKPEEFSARARRKRQNGTERDRLNTKALTGTNLF